MRSPQRPLTELLNDILVWGGRIEEFLTGMTFEAFSQSALHQFAVVKCIEAIGEASGNIRRLYPGFAEDHSYVEFEMAYRARNRLSHGYDRIDVSTVWITATVHVPPFVERVRGLVG